MNRSIFLTSFLPTQSSGLNPFTSPAMRQAKADGSKRVMGPTPETPRTRASQLSRAPRPSGETMPIPVITTLLAIVPSRSPRRRLAAPPLRVALDVLHGVADAVDLLGVLVADLDLERLLERHDQ